MMTCKYQKHAVKKRWMILGIPRGILVLPVVVVVPFVPGAVLVVSTGLVGAGSTKMAVGRIGGGGGGGGGGGKNLKLKIVSC